MKKVIFSAVMILIAGCASSDRMVRMSGGVFDEYSVPKSSRIRSEKYQKMSREFSSSRRANKMDVAGLDDTLVNIWPFFFRSNDYWSILWPFIDKDPYGFAIRPLYNHEGDDYSILFPLSAWNTADKHGWVTLFGWNSTGFGLVPLTWQWKDGLSGGAYYTPLFIYKYDNNPLEYNPVGNRIKQNWKINEHFWEFCGIIHDRYVLVKKDKWLWLFYLDIDSQNSKNLWNYHFKGNKPFPANQAELNRFRQEIFAKLPRITLNTYGFIPLWIGEFQSDGDYWNRFLLIAGNQRSNGGKNYSFDILGKIIGEYKEVDKSYYSGSTQKTESFISRLLFSKFITEYRYEQNGTWRLFQKLGELTAHYNSSFSQKKPEIEDTLKKLDPALKLPATVVDTQTCDLFIRELRGKYEFPTYPEYSGMVLPLFDYHIGKDFSRCILFPLLTWWKKGKDFSKFSSIPLLTFVSRYPEEESTVIFSPLSYYAKEHHRKREDFPVFSGDRQRVGEYQCAELRDRYAVCGLFYRGRFGFNAAKDGVDAKQVEKLRNLLRQLPEKFRMLENIRKRIIHQTQLNDRWQTKGEIERLKKLIRYEELKLEKQNLARDEKDYSQKVGEALTIAGNIGLKADANDFSDSNKADELRKKLVENFTVLRYYEDIGNGLFFRKEKNHNGDYNWHFMHILAGGEKQGDKESTHILHLLYRYRKEGNRSEKIFFPFISSVQDGKNYRFSFLWRVFSLSKRDGKTGGYIFFIPFGSEW